MNFHDPGRGKRYLRSLGLFLCAGLLGFMLWACDEHPAGIPSENQAPHVQFTGGPGESAPTPYRVHVYWQGWDDDGVIDHYEYALDPPDVFTEEEIAHPETSPGVNIDRIPRGGGAPDLVRVGKHVDGVLHTFTYVPLHDTDHIFYFSTPDADSTLSGATYIPTETFSGYHILYLRAQDDAGAYSSTERTAFNTWSLAPSAHIVRPNTEGGIIITGPRISISWSGIDPDPPGTYGRPIGYYYKLVDLRSLSPPLSVFRPFNVQSTIFRGSDHIPWTYQSAETTSLSLILPVPGEFIFAVRAVDAMGAVEPFVDLWRSSNLGNAFLIRSAAGAGLPELAVYQSSIGVIDFKGQGQSYEFELPARKPLRFEWQGSAESYGGTIEGYSWGVDLEDLDKDGPESGWSPWSRSSTSATLFFPGPGLHAFYIRVRDISGTVTSASYVLNVADVTFERDVLFVDDYLDKTYPRDSERDAFWEGLFQNSGRFSASALEPQKLLHEVGGEGDRNYFFTPDVPSYGFLGQYRMVIWNTHGEGYAGRSGLREIAYQRTRLQTYMSMGGKVWLTGTMTFSGTVRTGTIFPLSFHPGDFAWDFLKIATTRLENDKGMEWEDSMVGVDAWNPEDPIFASMQPDPAKFHPLAWIRAGITHCDAVFEPIYMGDQGIPGRADSLYAYRAAGPARKNRSSDFENRLCAMRWHDPNPERAQGRVMWFGFPLYYMKTEQVQETFNRAIDWFREESTFRPSN